VTPGIGDVAVQVPKTRDRSGSGIHFSSNLLPPYLRKSRSVEELLPWLYLKGVNVARDELFETINNDLNSVA